MNTVYYLLMIVLLLVGLFINILGLPGLWLMVVAYVGYGWLTGWDVYVGWPSVIAVFVLALIAEGVEFMAGAAGSAAAGGRKRGMAGAIVGGIIGGILGTPILPIVGTIIGACAGAFIGAAVLEFSDKDAAHAMRVGIGAAKGRFWGIVSKTAVGLVMFLVAALAGLPYGGGTSAAGTTTAPGGAGGPLVPTSAPTTAAATLPATLPTTTAPGWTTYPPPLSTTLPTTLPAGTTLPETIQPTP